MDTDNIEKIQDALIQHGPLSNRIYLMHLGKANPAEIIAVLNQMAIQQGYTKIFAKVPKKQSEVFIQQGYRIEAAVPLFYRSQDEAVFLARYLSPDRSKLKEAKLVNEYLLMAKSRASQPAPIALPEGAQMRICTLEDADQMSGLYQSVFTTYPFPIHDPDYIRDTMQKHIIYFCVDQAGKLIALSSAELNPACSNVEMTDFATDPAWGGHGLAACLLARMEQEMVPRHITTAYTIARALSPSMNITFARMGYHYGGTLANNTNIAGSIESMNVWYKYLVQDDNPEQPSS